MKTKRFPILAILAVLIVGAIVGFVLWSRPPLPPPASSPVAAATALPSAPAISVDFYSLLPGLSPSPMPRGNEIPVWENKIDEVLRSQASSTQSALILLNLLPTLPEEGQIAAASHIVNLLPDEAYAQARPVVLNPGLPEPVLSVFFSDLMNRGDSIKLHMFLDLARIANHPFHEEALDDLQIYLGGDDYGADWAKWNSALEEYLKNAQAQ